MRPKYAIDEIERRWLVRAGMAEPMLTVVPMTVNDKYLGGTRMRLRKVEQPEKAPVFKLCKKYGGRRGPTEAITNIYLDAADG